MDKEWYFIGLWLGDGSKESTSITSADNEIIQYLKELSLRYNLNFSTYRKTPNSKALEVNLGHPISYTRSICQYTLNGHFLKQYNSLKQAANETGIVASSISHNALGKYKHAGGYIWKYGDKLYYNALRQQLKELKLINNKHIPVELFSQSDENKKLFLAGLIDSDGTKNYQTISITQKDQDIILNLNKLCQSLGYATKIKSSLINGNPYYKLIIKGDLRDIPILLPRKRPTKISRFTKPKIKPCK